VKHKEAPIDRSAQKPEITRRPRPYFAEPEQAVGCRKLDGDQCPPLPPDGPPRANEEAIAPIVKPWRRADPFSRHPFTVDDRERTWRKEFSDTILIPQKGDACCRRGYGEKKRNMYRVAEFLYPALLQPDYRSSFKIPGRAYQSSFRNHSVLGQYCRWIVTGCA
jgi:hypothetical protein